MALDFTKSDFEQLQKIVIGAAKQELLPGFGKQDFTYKDDGSVITSADLAMQKKLDFELKRAWPQIALLGEEMAEQVQQKVINSGQAYWCIDPLDGTNNYAAGIPLFAVSIALIDNREPVVGLIYDPARDEMFTARKGEGAFLNGEKLSAKNSAHQANRIIAEIEMKRLPQELAVRLITEQPYGSHRNSGSSVIDWCWVAAGRLDVYLHGGQKLWDCA
ncbi:MAG: inositol monophosphatase family protein, partial [Gammaproteobacteria bacterium]|nr:inositol monophosphatase family protein [Gammaproteobacteria bacterium]